MRGEILKQADISKRVNEFVSSEAKDLANSPLATSEKYEDMLQEVFPLEDKALDKIFDAPATQLEQELQKAVTKLYKEQEKRFGAEILHKIERDVYLQTLDNYWMQHLETMDHLRDGIRWMAVGQRDPLVEYRRQSQRIFEEMQLNLRRDVVRMLFHARPIDESQLNKAVETELTLAARNSVDNANKIIEAEEFQEADFKSEAQEQSATRKVANKRKKARKAERKRKSKARRKK
jgi:preprotein translocase subunit SecA